MYNYDLSMISCTMSNISAACTEEHKPMFSIWEEVLILMQLLATSLIIELEIPDISSSPNIIGAASEATLKRPFL